MGIRLAVSPAFSLVLSPERADRRGVSYRIFRPGRFSVVVRIAQRSGFWQVTVSGARPFRMVARNHTTLCACLADARSVMLALRSRAPLPERVARPGPVATGALRRRLAARSW